jgi:Post-segregation antitoxin CcdA
MGKKHVQVTIDADLLEVARAMKLNISEIAQISLDAVVTAHMEFMKETALTLEEVVRERQEMKDFIHQEAGRIKSEKQQVLKDMLLHARAAKEAGISRAQAEQEFGQVFPSSVWGGE